MCVTCLLYYVHKISTSSCIHLKTVLVDNLSKMARIGYSFRFNMHVHTVEEKYLVSYVSHFSGV